MINKLIKIIIVFFLICTNLAYAKKLVSLREVEKPSRIIINNGLLFITDHTIKLHQYSMKDFSYKLFARKGEGPKELRFPPTIAVFPDHIFVQSSIRRGMTFSYNGELLKEYILRNFSSNYFYPVGKHFAMEKASETSRDGSYSVDISIYQYTDDKGFEYKKLFYYKKYEKNPKTNGKGHYPLVKPYFGFFAKDNKVFVGDSDRGCYVEIYDSEGQEAGKIKLYLDPVKVTEQFKNETLKKLKESPHWGIVNNMYHIYFPEYFPAFYRFAVDNQKVYFLTYKKKDDRRELIITDYKGNILKRSTVPVLDEYEVHTNFSIEDDKFYYIKENEDTEEWELHVEDIK